MTPEAKLKEMGIELAEASSFHPAMAVGVITGNLLYLSGTTPPKQSDKEWRGRLGEAYTVEEGYQAARECAIQSLAMAKSVLGDLSRIKRVVKVLGMVNSAPGFGDQPQVINGFSDLMVEVFGENGRHARSAVGMGGLPGNVSVEVEVIFEVK